MERKMDVEVGNGSQGVLFSLFVSSRSSSLKNMNRSFFFVFHLNAISR